VSSSNKTLGGYLGLELPKFEIDAFKDFRMFNSARSAFASLVDQLAIEEVWLPRYLCDSMIQIFDRRVVELNYYDLRSDFSIEDDIILAENSVILYVNYFGVCNFQSEAVIKQYGKESVVIDNSQAWFSQPFDALATIYSPRKFFGLPDGGVLHCIDPRIQPPTRRDESSQTRMDHLISRITNTPEMAYKEYLVAEQSIAEMPVLGMSQLTERLLQSIDFQAAKNARRRNANYLHHRLGEHNQLDLNISEDTAPLCYPVLPKCKMASRTDLIRQRVFVPSYWPEVLSHVDESSFEWELVRNGLFLPCDQRYGEKDMDRLISLLGIS